MGFDEGGRKGEIAWFNVNKVDSWIGRELGVVRRVACYGPSPTRRMRSVGEKGMVGWMF